MSHQYQLIVIGSGSGGKDASILAARAGRRVLVVEKQSLGGTCFHRGCHAIRALRACAWHYSEAERSSRFGLLVDHSGTGWTDWIGTQRRVSAKLAEDLSRTLEALHVHIRFGSGQDFESERNRDTRSLRGSRSRIYGKYHYRNWLTTRFLERQGLENP